MIYAEIARHAYEKDTLKAWREHGRQTEKMATAPVDRSGQGNAGGKCPGRLQDVESYG
jgi:hypothetical protein